MRVLGQESIGSTDEALKAALHLETHQASVLCLIAMINELVANRRWGNNPPQVLGDVLSGVALEPNDIKEVQQHFLSKGWKRVDIKFHHDIGSAVAGWAVRLYRYL